MKKNRHTLKWFQNRRGKFIYRKPIRTVKGKRCCDMCEKTKVKVGLPQNLFDYQNELGIRYFDKPLYQV